VHRAVTATIHADLRSRKDAPHRLGLIDMNVAIGLDAQPCKLEAPGRRCGCWPTSPSSFSGFRFGADAGAVAALVPAPVELKRGTGSSTNRSPNLQHCKALWIIRVSSAAIARGRDLPGETGQRSTASRTVEPADCKEGD
jgi:hypothetical protein